MATFGTFATGQILTAAELNTVLPACVLTGSIVTVSGTDQYLPFTTEEYDPLNFHSNSTNTTRITPTISGFYLCTLSVNNLNGAGGNFRALGNIRRNRASASLLDNRFANFDINNYAPDDFTVTGVTFANGTTDYIESYFLQNSASNKTIDVVFSVVLVART